MLTVHEALVGARNRLEQGFIKGSLYKEQRISGDSKKGPFCVRGALLHTITGTADWAETVEENELRMIAEQELMKVKPLVEPLYGEEDVADYNNSTEMTHEEVISWIDRAIAATAPEPEEVELEEREVMLT